MTSGVLILLLVLTPGPLDSQGGHIDPATGQYHFHAGPSVQFRYVDKEGRIWEGNSPLPDEVHTVEWNDTVWNSGFLLFVLVGAVLSTGLAFFLGPRVRGYRSYRRIRRRRKRRSSRAT